MDYELNSVKLSGFLINYTVNFIHQLRNSSWMICECFSQNPKGVKSIHHGGQLTSEFPAKWGAGSSCWNHILFRWILFNSCSRNWSSDVSECHLQLQLHLQHSKKIQAIYIWRYLWATSWNHEVRYYQIIKII